MAAHVCVHVCCSLILHKARQLSCFRRTFHTDHRGKGNEVNGLPILKCYSHSFGSSGVVISGVLCLGGLGVRVRDSILLVWTKNPPRQLL